VNVVSLFGVMPVSKATIIGAGNLGSCISYEVANRGLVDELVLIDVYGELAEGNAEDIKQALAFRNNTEVYAGDYDDAKGSDLIVVTAGKPRTPDMKSRTELLKVNRAIVEDVASRIKSVEGDFPVMTLTNPVDLMTFLMWKHTSFERNRILGSAGQLDSSRFRVALSRRYGVPVRDIEAYVIGEHGEDQVPVFSKVRSRGKEQRFTRKEREEIKNEIKESALRVISKKGATIFAPANNTADAVESILRDEKRLATCSVILSGEYGLSDLSIGVPVILGRRGAERILEWDLDEDEKEVFYRGAGKIKEMLLEE